MPVVERGAAVALALAMSAAPAVDAPACPDGARQAALAQAAPAGMRLLANGGALHRFFDTSPISPSGRYLALTRFGNW